MYKRLTFSLAMLAAGAAMLAASGIASTGSAKKASSPQGSTARKGGIFRASLFAGIENIDPQRSYYVPESQYEWLTQRPLLNFAHAQGARGYRIVNEGARSYSVSRDGRTGKARTASRRRRRVGALRPAFRALAKPLQIGATLPR